MRTPRIDTAGVEGFEPPLRGPEPRVLPLDDTPGKAEAFYIAHRRQNPRAPACGAPRLALRALGSTIGLL